MNAEDPQPSRLLVIWRAVVRMLTQPHYELPRWQSRVRWGVDLGHLSTRQFIQDEAPQMAAALAYRTLFGLVPVLVLATIVLRALGGFQRLRDWLPAVMSQAGLNNVRVTGEGVSGTEPSMAEWLVDLIASVESLDLTAITWVGLALLVYSAIGLMVTIEECFNRINRAPGGRPWGRRLPIYWTVLTLGPPVLALPAVLSRRLEDWTASWGGGSGGVLGFGVAAVAFMTLWLLLFSVYKWLPHTHVRSRGALLGGLVAAIAIEALRWSLGAYIGNALSVRQLYGSLGLIPLFLLWVYVAWLVVLFGAEVAQVAPRVREDEATLERPDVATFVDPAAILVVAGAIAARFSRGEPATIEDLVEETRLHGDSVLLWLEQLTQEGILHRLDRDEPSYVLSRPPEQIPAEDLLDIAFRMAGDPEQMPILGRLRGAQRDLAKNLSLASLLHRGDASA